MQAALMQHIYAPQLQFVIPGYELGCTFPAAPAFACSAAPASRSATSASPHHLLFHRPHPPFCLMYLSSVAECMLQAARERRAFRLEAQAAAMRAELALLQGDSFASLWPCLPDAIQQ